MMAMAVVTGRDLGGIMGGAQGNGFAVIGFHVVFEAVLMTLAAAFVAGRFEVPAFLRFDLVGAVAIGADGATGIPLGKQLAVNAFHVGLLHTHMTFSTGIGDMGMIDRGVTINATEDIVNAMAIVAGGGDNKSEFEQGTAMDTFHVLAGGLREFHFVFRRQVGVAMAPGAGRWKVEFEDRGVALFNGDDIMAAMATGAGGRTGGPHVLADPVNTGRIFLGDLIMTTSAGGRWEFGLMG